MTGYCCHCLYGHHGHVVTNRTDVRMVIMVTFITVVTKSNMVARVTRTPHKFFTLWIVWLVEWRTSFEVADSSLSLSYEDVIFRNLFMSHITHRNNPLSHNLLISHGSVYARVTIRHILWSLRTDVDAWENPESVWTNSEVDGWVVGWVDG
jgi:hypothetical protein